MSEMIQSADAIRNLAKLFKSMEKAADQLESIGSLDQAKGEKEKMLAELDAALLVKRTEVAAQAEAAQAERHASEQYVEKANAHAAQIIADAEQKGRDHLIKVDDEASAKLLKVKADAAKIVAAMEVKAADVTAELRLMSNQYAEVAIEVGAQKVEHERLTAAITAARAEMARIMGQ